MTIAAGVTLAGLAGLGGYVVLDGRTGPGEPPAATPVSTGTVAVRRTDVVERRHVTGTLGYAGAHRVVAPAAGTLTWLPALGTVVTRGQPAYESDGVPVTLMYGARAVWRSFTLGMTDGADVRQLEANLAALGHGRGMTVDRHFSRATATAVRRWQRAVGRPATGALPLGRIVFVPGAIRVGGHDLQPGTPLGPGAQVLSGTGDRPAVTAEVSPRQLPGIRVGDTVAVTMPDRATRDGRITEIGVVSTPAGEEEDATVSVTVRVDGEVGRFVERAQVRVSITVAVRHAVLAVPLTALNGLPGGEYEVVVEDGATTRRIPVRTGLFDETTGLAEVTGPGLAEGQSVRVPRADA